MSTETKLAAALDMADRGFAVFPLVPNGKTPALKNWQNEATTDKAQITKWWQAEPQANIGHPTINEVVIDVDPKHGGKESFQVLAITEDLPKTLVSETQSGGNHIVYALPPHTIVRGGTNKLGQGVDIRSWGGYIVCPGSTIDDRPYRWLNARKPAPAPQWLIERCNTAARSKGAGERVVDEDDAAVKLAQEWLDRHAPDAHLGTIDDTAFKVAARLYDFGVSQSTATQMLVEWSELHAFPPMQLERIQTVAASAGRNRDNPIGSKHPDAAGFEPVDAGDTPAKPQRGPLATPWRFVDVGALKRREWVIPDVACKQNVGMLAGPAGVSKTTFVIAMILAAVTGREDILGIPIGKRSRVWLWNQEDDIDELMRRLAAAMHQFNVSPADMVDEHGAPMLFLNSGVDKPLMFAVRTSEFSIRRAPDVDAVIAEIQSHNIDLAIFDPLVEFHQGEENDNVQMRAVLGTVREIAVKGNCATFVCAHTRKPDTASSRGFAGEMDSVRGASAQLGVVRTLFTLNTASPKDAKEWSIDGSHLGYVRFDMAKNNLAKMWTEPRWLERQSVVVGGVETGESVGVLQPIVLKRRAPTASGDLPTILAEIIATKLERHKFHTTTQILMLATEAQKAAFGEETNRSRNLLKAFKGADEILTDSGKLVLLRQKGNGGHKLKLGDGTLTTRLNKDEESEA